MKINFIFLILVTSNAYALEFISKRGIAEPYPCFSDSDGLLPLDVSGMSTLALKKYAKKKAFPTAPYGKMN